MRILKKILLYIGIVFLGMIIREVIPWFSVDFLAGWVGCHLFYGYLNGDKS